MNYVALELAETGKDKHAPSSCYSHFSSIQYNNMGICSQFNKDRCSRFNVKCILPILQFCRPVVERSTIVNYVALKFFFNTIQ